MDRRADSGVVESPPLSRRVEFGLADHADEAELRALLRETPLGGSIETTLQREPDYFAGVDVEGPFHQVLVARLGQGGPVVGMATRSVRNRYVDGIPQPVGYLGGLRIRPDARSGPVLAHGFRELQDLHADGRADFYLTTITEGNVRALRCLTRARAGLPAYHELGRYFTYVLPARGRPRRRRVPGLSVCPLERRHLPTFVEFLGRQGAERLFFPCLTRADFEGERPTFRGLPIAQILCAWHGDQIQGCLAAWNQSDYKQTVVERYHGLWAWGRHPYNLLARALGLPMFPAPGGRLNSLTLALPLVANHDPAVWSELLAAVRGLPVTRSGECLMVGLFERDPLVALVRPTSLHCYVTRVFVVCWDPARVQPQRFDGRNLYLELGCL